MNYRVCPGIVLTKVCGVYLLVPTRAASERCPGILRMPLPLLFLWLGVKNGVAYERFSPMIQGLLRKSESEAKELVDRSLQKLHEAGYLIAEGEE